MRLPTLPAPVIVGAALLALACQPEIGDACQIHSDCSTAGDRICDPTVLGGYCTVFNCEPGKCPDEAVCVAFRTAPASVPECSDISGADRFTRTFCMRSCAANDECRTGDGFRCVDISDDNPWAAVVIERGTSHSGVCTRPLSEAPAAASEGAGVCNPPLDASFPPPRRDGGSPDAPHDAPVESSRDAAPVDAPGDRTRSSDGGAPDAKGASDAHGRDASARDAQGDR